MRGPVFFIMARYIFIREYNHRNNDGEIHAIIRKGSILTKTDEGYCTPIGDYPAFCLSKEWTAELGIHTLELDENLFKTAFQSFGYTNWLNEKKANIDERGDPLYPTLTKTPETLVMYLMELGVQADTLIRYIYGPENKYLEYKYLVQEFGKML